MSNSNEVDGRGALVLMPELPLRGRFTMLISDSFCFEVTETATGVRLDFRPRTLRERVEVWRRKLGL